MSAIAPAVFDLNEYLLIITPTEEVYDKVLSIKDEFARKYKSVHAKFGKPHITLANFVQYPLMQNRIVDAFSRISSRVQPIKIELNDFGSFSSHTIYTNITTKLPIRNLVRELRSSAHKLLKPNNETPPHFILEPHLTIARKLLPWQYEPAWNEYSRKTFSGRFTASEMTLLSRPLDQKKYNVVASFPFNENANRVTQGKLF